MRYKALLAVILVVFIAYMGFSHGQEVSGYKGTIAKRDARIVNLETEIKMRDTQMAVYKDEQADLNNTIKLIQDKQTELQQRFDDQTGGSK